MRLKCKCHPSLPARAFQPTGARVTGRPVPFARAMTLHGCSGGGGGCCFFSCVSNTVSCFVCNAVNAVSCAICSVAQTIGQAGATLDCAVRSAIPGGWATVGALAATVLTAGAASGALASDLAVESSVAMEDGSVLTTFSDGSTALTDASGATTYTTAGGDTIASIDTSTSALPNADPNTGLTAPSTTSTPGACSVLNQPDVGTTTPTGSSVSSTGAATGAPSGTVGSLNPALPSAGSVSGTSVGMSGQLSSGAVLGTGLPGQGLPGISYELGANGLPATNAFGVPIQASSVGLCGISAGTGSCIGLKCVNDARKAANMLKNIFSGSPTTTATGAKVASTGASTGTISPLSATTPVASTGITPLTAGTMKGTPTPLGALGSLVPANETVTEPTQTALSMAYNPLSLQEIQNANTGGQMVPHYSEGSGVCEPVKGPGTMHGNPNPISMKQMGINLTHGSSAHLYKKGGEVHEHHPEFYSEGGLKNTYVKGAGDGTSDSIPAMLANGEFVIPADVVSSLGNGDNDSGAKVLDEFLKTIRQHKRRADANHLPPDSKGALGYLLEAKKKVKK